MSPLIPALAWALLLSAAPPARAESSVPNVGMDEYIVARAAEHPVVRTFGAATCVVLALQDPVSQVGALAHVSAEADVQGSLDKEVFPALLAAGAKIPQLRAQLFGGWKNDTNGMFKDQDWTSARTVAALKAALFQRGIPIARDETLADPDPARSNGIKPMRSLSFDLRTGEVSDIEPGPDVPAPPARSPAEEARFQRQARLLLPAPFSLDAAPAARP